MKLLRECVFFGHGNAQQAANGWKGNHVLRYHLYRILGDVDLRDADASAYSALIQRDVWNTRTNARFFWKMLLRRIV